MRHLLLVTSVVNRTTRCPQSTLSGLSSQALTSIMGGRAPSSWDYVSVSPRGLLSQSALSALAPEVVRPAAPLLQSPCGPQPRGSQAAAWLTPWLCGSLELYHGSRSRSPHESQCPHPYMGYTLLPH